MRYKLRHTTSYSYSWAVDISHHMLHLALPDLPRQRVKSCHVDISPTPGAQNEQHDHFGNRVAYIAIAESHTRFDVELRAEVEVDPAAPPDPAATPAWESLRDALAGDGFPAPVLESEFVQDSPLAQPSDAAIVYAMASFPAGRPVLAAVLDLTQRIFTDFKYDPAATDTFTPVVEVMQKRAGVCQDFAHLQISMLRGLGLAARYVSGYIRTMRSTDGRAGDAPDSGLRGADASHAWVSVWCGPQHGWIDVDPTNNLICSDEHVTAAIGRDYGDISPVRGVVLGGGPHRIGVAVELLPLG